MANTKSEWQELEDNGELVNYCETELDTPYDTTYEAVAVKLCNCTTCHNCPVVKYNSDYRTKQERELPVAGGCQKQLANWLRNNLK